MITKAIDTASWDFRQEQTTLVDVCRTGIDSSWMAKTAAHNLFKYAELKPRKGYSHLHIIALGDSEYYSGNRNADLFPETATTIKAASPRPGGPREFRILRGNKEMHGTFVKNAKVFRHHKHKPTDPSYGSVKMSAHNDDLHRVELIVELPDEQWGPQLQKIASGKGGPVWSMACRVPFDVCTICLNKAPTKEQYCDHAKNHLTMITKEGAYVGIVNESPNFFDISEVIVNADRTALTLCKAASLGTHVMSSADLAEEYGIVDDGVKAAAEKLARIEKRISGETKSMLLGTVPGALPADKIRALVDDRDSMGAACARMADKKACLHLPDFFRIVLGSRYSDFVDDVKLACAKLPTLFQDHAGDLIPFSFSSDLLSGRTVRAVDDIAEAFSLEKSAALSRAFSPVRHAPEPGSADRGRTAVADQMLRVYAGYKLAWLDRVQALNDDENNPLTNFALWQHYVDTAENGK